MKIHLFSSFSSIIIYVALQNGEDATQKKGREGWWWAKSTSRVVCQFEMRERSGGGRPAGNRSRQKWGKEKHGARGVRFIDQAASTLVWIKQVPADSEFSFYTLLSVAIITIILALYPFIPLCESLIFENWGGKLRPSKQRILFVTKRFSFKEKSWECGAIDPLANDTWDGEVDVADEGWIGRNMA